MEKDSQVKMGSTTCDLCDRPASGTRGQLVVCEHHAAQLKGDVKAASVKHIPLRAAPIMLTDKHSKHS